MREYNFTGHRFSFFVKITVHVSDAAFVTTEKMHQGLQAVGLSSARGNRHKYKNAEIEVFLDYENNFVVKVLNFAMNIFNNLLEYSQRIRR